jgi:hypothetical protein
MADILVLDLRTVERDGISRASAQVDGHELFFESADARLAASPEAFASALLNLAAGSGRRLVLDRPLDPRWKRNVGRVLQVWADWWGTPAALGDVLAAPRRPRRPRFLRPPASGVGLCFSLGVDSFFTLMRSGRRIDSLVFAEGFDMPLGDRRRIEAAEASTRAVARSVSARPIFIRTNLRDHPACMDLNWPRAHGGALAALGHLCDADVRSLLISSSKPAVADGPWGSHFRTDSGWSGARLSVEHFGERYRRWDKLLQVADEPLVREHLRVCWENRRPSGNCGACEKCVRTMLVLYAIGRLDAVPAFPQDEPLAALVDAVPHVIPDLRYFYRGLLPRLPDPAVHAAVERLLERAAPSPS